MPGLAITDNFMLGTAELMIGAQADLLNFTPSTHGLGLVKNVAVTNDPTYTELTQGVTNDIVASVKTNNTIGVTAEIYEYTTQNVAHGLGLAGTYAANTVTSLVDTTVSSGVTFDVSTGDGTNFTDGDYVFLKTGTADEDLIIRQIVSIAVDTITVNAAFTTSVPAGSVVSVVSALEIGTKAAQPYLALAVQGELVNTGKMAIFQFGKVRITKGFNFNFVSDNFSNLPFEFTIYDLVASDPNKAYFGTARGKYLAK